MATVTLSVKNVPKDLARRLAQRAERNHRSLQGELMAILHEAGGGLSITQIAEFVKRIGLKTPSESAAIVREMRDARSR